MIISSATRYEGGRYPHLGYIEVDNVVAKQLLNAKIAFCKDTCYIRYEYPSIQDLIEDCRSCC